MLRIKLSGENSDPGGDRIEAARGMEVRDGRFVWRWDGELE